MTRIVEFVVNNVLRGWFGTIGDNELELNSTMRDPVKLRMAIDDNKVESNLGALSFNTRRTDGSNTHDERALVMGRLRADKIGGAVYVAVSPSQHESVREVLYLDNDVAIFRVPVQAPNLGTQVPNTGTPVTRFYTDGGKFMINWQDDTGVPAGIIYRIVDPNDESTWVAVGKVPIELFEV